MPATPRRKTLFEKNFLDLSVDGCLLRAACFIDMDGRRTGMRTAMPTACCLFPEEEKLCLRRTF